MRRPGERLVCREVHRERPRAGDRLAGGKRPLADGGAVERTAASAGPVAFDDSENRWGERHETLATDDGARVGAGQPDVERVVPSSLVQRTNELGDAAGW